MTVALLILLLVVVAIAAHLAVRGSRTGAELRQARDQLDSAILKKEELSAEVVVLGDVRQQLAAASARLEVVEAERDRVLGKDGERAEETSKHVTKLKSDLESIRGELPKLLEHSSKAASGAERVEASMSTWTRRIANPQSRGAFGELAVENQLQSLGLERGRDYMRQVAGDDGRLRPDFVIRGRQRRRHRRREIRSRRGSRRDRRGPRR